MGQSSVQIVDHPNGKIAQVRGVIDGTFDLRPLIGEHEIVLFDLDGVTRITSFGVREWRSTVALIKAQYLCFVGCRPSVVAQFNLVPGFACGGELISFYLPYICPECNHVLEELVDLRTDSTIVENLAPPARSCPQCSAAMEFDDLPAAYFKYARSVAKPRPPLAASALIDDRSPLKPRRELTVKKDVEDTVTAFWLSGFLGDRRALRRLTEGVEGHVVLELAELEGVDDAGLAGLMSFLREVGETFMCRVPNALVAPIAEALARENITDCRLVSVEVTVRCHDCGTSIDLELDAIRLAPFLDDEPPHKHCPSCAHRLDASTLPPDVLATLRREPFSEAPEPVQIYHAHRTGARGLAPGRSQTYTAPSQLLFGNYRILRRLGRGGMGEVLLARYVGVGKFEKLVVLKRIRQDYLSNPDAMKEFQREARVTARLSHPNVVQIFDFGRYEDEYFFAMEYVNGIDLRQALRLCANAGLSWPPGLCMRVISDVCAGLQAAHEYKNEAGVAVPIYHRDVSPENVIISVDGAVKLMDFGIAKTADSSVNTGSGVFKGKQAYSAPEQLDAAITADHRTDIYAAGIVLFELLALRRYLGDEPTLNTVYAASMAARPQISAERIDAPPELQAVFEKATAADRTNRYQSAHAFRDQLERLMKVGDYPTNHDLAEFVRRIMALGPPQLGRSDNTPHSFETPIDGTVDTARVRTRQVLADPDAATQKVAKVGDDEG